MLSISNYNSFNSFRGIKKTTKPVQETKEVKPNNNKAGKATAVLASFALASTLAGCNARTQDKPQNAVETTQPEVSQQTTENGVSKDGRFGILSNNPFCPHI